MERLEHQPSDVEVWARENIGEITSVMDRYALICRSYVEYHGLKNALRFSPNERTLSEMPLCHSLAHMTPPAGYDLVQGEISMVKQKPYKSGPHNFFFLEDSNNVVCLTAGQFVRSNDSGLKPGDRMRVLKSKAPELIVGISDQVSILAGELDEIQEKLGLAYIVK